MLTHSKIFVMRGQNLVFGIPLNNCCTDEYSLRRYFQRKHYNSAKLDANTKAFKVKNLSKILINNSNFSKKE